MRRIILVSLFLLSGFFAIQAQSLVKMSVPKQSDKPLQVVALFDEEIPEDMPVVLGVMGYEVIGGVEPYSFEWLQNGEVVGTSDIVTVNPKNGDQIDLRVRDANRCFSSTSFKLRTVATLTGSEEGKETGKIRVYPTLANDGIIHVALTESDEHAQTVIRIFDMKGALRYHQTAAGSHEIRANLQPGMYVVAVTAKGKHVVEKVVVE